MRWLLLVFAGCSFSGPTAGLTPGEDAPAGDSTVLPPGDGTVTTNPDATTSHDAGTTTTDTDGDGVPDTADNCPTVANADQANEDHDAFGDACDPCPPYPETTPVTDTDHDGVSDKCDPRPTTAGDKIVSFAGFASGQPAGWTGFGTWTAANGQLTGSGTASLGPSFPTHAGETVTAQVTLDQDNTLAGVALASQDLKTYVECDLFHNTDFTGNVSSGSIAFDQSNHVGKSSFGFSTSTPFTVVLTRLGGNYTCGTVQNTAINTMSSTLVPVYAGTELANGKGHFDWFMVVSHD